MWHAWGRTDMRAGLWWGNLKVRDKLCERGLRWEESDKTDLKERRWKIVDWINMARDRQKWGAVVNTVTNFGVIKPGELVD
jgi:hypothetical protein